VQHEHIYELTVDGRPADPQPLEPPAQKSRQEKMADRFGDELEKRINSLVDRELERALGFLDKEDERE